MSLQPEMGSAFVIYFVKPKSKHSHKSQIVDANGPNFGLVTKIFLVSQSIGAVQN